MSETQERETEFISGVIEGIIQKGADKWQVAVKPEGSQYTKNLWTKDAELVDSLSVKIGQAGAFVCGVSHWTTNEGKPVRSLWIDSLGNGAESVATPAAVPKAAQQFVDSAPVAGRDQAIFPKPATEGMSKEEWARKDSAIHKMACIKTAADALKHTIPSDPTPEDLSKFLARCTTLTLSWHRSVLAERDDPTGESVPF